MQGHRSRILHPKHFAGKLPAGKDHCDTGRWRRQHHDGAKYKPNGLATNGTRSLHEPTGELLLQAESGAITINQQLNKEETI
jgi:hypothetical protein